MTTEVGAEEEKHSENNIFHILGVQDFEIRHSNFLAWLLQNEEKFLRKFLTNKKICNLSQDEVSKMCLKRENVTVSREYRKENNGRSVDIVVEFKKEKLAIIIENKWHATEGENQLSDYYNLLKNSKNFKDYKTIYIFLTLNGIEPKNEIDKKNYLSVSYKSILEIMEKLYDNKKIVRDKEIFIKQYIEILRENTEDVMDRVKIYYELYKENKEIMTEMVEYIPNIKQRAQVERDLLQTTENLKLKSLNQNTYIWFTQKEVSDKCLNNNLPEDWLEFCLSNEPYNVLAVQFVVNSDKENKWLKFSQEFRKHFNIVDKSKNSNYAILSTETVVLSNKNSGYLTEQEFQDEIKEKLNKYFTDPNSSYFKILDFVKNYKF